MMPEAERYRVFLSHSQEDTYVVENLIRRKIEESGALVFVDVAEIKFGDDIRDSIFVELKKCNELVVLCTPIALKRPWIFAELGIALSQAKRIILIVYGPTELELQELGILTLVGTNKRLKLDHFDNYIVELSARVMEHLHV